MRHHFSLSFAFTTLALVACGANDPGTASKEPAGARTENTTSPSGTETDGGSSAGDAGGKVCPSGGGAGNANHVCSSDATWKSQAQSDCTSQGLSLGTFTPDEYCGKGSSDSATWTCCTSAAPPAPTCSLHEIKGACSADATLSASATSQCKAAGEVLAAFTPDDACGAGRSKTASYTCCPEPEPHLKAFPPPPSTDPASFTWAFYDNPQAVSVFEDFAPQAYVEFSAREGQTFSATLTAMKSSEIWTPDPTKQIDGAIFEGELVGGKYVWTPLARGASEGGVLILTARSGGSDRLHVFAYEAAASSYPAGISPSVSSNLVLSCATGHHADCALGGEPGDSCTIAPASCDGPVTWCFAPLGACGNAGRCERLDIGCSGFYAPVCTCSGVTELNACYATIHKESVLHDGECTSGAMDASAPPPKH